MNLILKDMKPTVEKSPPRFIIHGDPKIGKTTFVAGSPNPIILDVEGGSGNVNITRIDANTLNKVIDFQDVMNVIMHLYQQEHSFQTFAIDSVDWLERLIHDKIVLAANDAKIKTVEDIPYGRGFGEAVIEFKKVIAGLEMLRKDRNMSVGFICHSQIKTFSDPTSESYDRICLKLHKTIEGILTEWSDVIFYATKKVFTSKHDKGFGNSEHKAKDGGRVIYTEGEPSYLAGNRYGLPKELPMNWEAFNNALATK